MLLLGPSFVIKMVVQRSQPTVPTGLGCKMATLSLLLSLLAQIGAALKPGGMALQSHFGSAIH